MTYTSKELSDVAYIVDNNGYKKLVLTADDGELVEVELPYLNRALEKIPLFGYGHSHMASDVYNTVGARYLDRVAARLHMGTITNRAVSGRRVPQVANDMFGTSGSSWVVGTRGLVIIHTGGAESNSVDLVNAADQRASIFNNLRAMLLLLGAGARVESSTFTQVGTGWALSAGANYSGGSVQQTTTEGAYAEFVHTGDKVTIIASSLHNSLSNIGARYIHVTVDGVEVEDSPFDPWDKSSTLDAVGKFPIELTGMGEGPHTIRLTAGVPVVNDTNNWFALDVALTPSANPPLVLVLKEVDMAASSLANHNALLDLVEEACAGLSYVKMVDLNQGYDLATMAGPDGNHPNDLGESHYADVICQALSEVTFRHGLNRLL